MEVYQAERTAAGGPPLWLHSLCYAQSLEAQRFRAGVGRERDTLLRLIAAKQHILLPTPAALGAGGAGPVDVGGRVGREVGQAWSTVLVGVAADSVCQPAYHGGTLCFHARPRH